MHVDDARHWIARRAQSLTEESLGGRGIPLRREQKIDGLTGRVHGAVQIFVFTLDLDIGLVGAVALLVGFRWGRQRLFSSGA